MPDFDSEMPDNMISVVSRYDVHQLDGLMLDVAKVIDDATRHFMDSRKDYIKDHWSPEAPSSAGDPPAKITGYLEESIKVQRRDDKGRFSTLANAVYWGLQVEAEYGAALEFGYPPRNLAPRPFIAPAFFGGFRNYMELITTELNFAIARRATGAKAEWMLSKL